MQLIAYTFIYFLRQKAGRTPQIISKLFYSFLALLIANNLAGQSNSKVHSTDILHFWEAFDLIVTESDSLKQIAILDSLYLSRASIGLDKIREVRNYQAAEYIELINRYPKFWNSIRPNTLKAPQLETELNKGIRDLQMLYPKLKPADIYFTIGAMRTNGTTQGNKVLIGGELAMGDSNIDLSEFEGRTKAWLENYFATEPIQNLVFLNIHEFVHTQQKAMPQSLLFISFYEGIAEYLAVQVTGKASPVPAINYGKAHPAVKKKFEAEMFEEKLYEWLWSNAPNEFDTRDLAYYIGYAIAEMYHLKSPDKAQALIDLIDLDYSKETKVLQMIDQSGFFEKKILKQDTLSSLKDPEKYLGQYIYLKGELKQGDKFQLLGVAVDSSFLAVESSDYIAGGILLKIEPEAADDNEASSLDAEYRLVSLFTGANAKAYPLKPN